MTPAAFTQLLESPTWHEGFMNASGKLITGDGHFETAQQVLSPDDLSHIWTKAGGDVALQMELMHNLMEQRGWARLVRESMTLWVTIPQRCSVTVRTKVLKQVKDLAISEQLKLRNGVDGRVIWSPAWPE